MPKADGKGQSMPPTKTPQASVDVTARTDTPNEHKSGAAHLEGPHSARKK